jgi:hypothetical protein
MTERAWTTLVLAVVVWVTPARVDAQVTPTYVHASRDKDFIVVEDATHNIEPCTEYETQKGQYGNATRNFFNYVSRWISSRF